MMLINVLNPVSNQMNKGENLTIKEHDMSVCIKRATLEDIDCVSDLFNLYRVFITKTATYL